MATRNFPLGSVLKRPLIAALALHARIQRYKQARVRADAVCIEIGSVCAESNNRAVPLQPNARDKKEPPQS
jgi:hypothetical protein